MVTATAQSTLALPSMDSIDYYNARVNDADRLHDLGIDLCYARDQHKEALEALYRAAELREGLLGKTHPDTALSYSRIASIQTEYGRNAHDALVAARRELRISQQLLKGSRNSIAEVDETTESWMAVRLAWFETVLSGVGALSRDQKKKYCSQLLQSIAMEQLGDEHAAVHEWELAITHYNNALTVESNSYGRNIIDAADLHVKAADCLLQMNDYEGSIDELANAEKKYRRAFSSNTLHRTIGEVYCKMAEASLAQKNFDDALARYAKAYTIFEETFGTRHQKSRDILADIKLVTVREMEQIRRDEIQRMKGFKTKATTSPRYTR